MRLRVLMLLSTVEPRLFRCHALILLFPLNVCSALVTYPWIFGIRKSQTGCTSDIFDIMFISLSWVINRWASKELGFKHCWCIYFMLMFTDCFRKYLSVRKLYNLGHILLSVSLYEKWHMLSKNVSALFHVTNGLNKAEKDWLKKNEISELLPLFLWDS